MGCLHADGVRKEHELLGGGRKCAIAGTSLYAHGSDFWSFCRWRCARFACAVAQEAV